jgi:hypothetical protein
MKISILFNWKIVTIQFIWSSHSLVQICSLVVKSNKKYSYMELQTPVSYIQFYGRHWFLNVLLNPTYTVETCAYTLHKTPVSYIQFYGRHWFLNVLLNPTYTVETCAYTLHKQISFFSRKWLLCTTKGSSPIAPGAGTSFNTQEWWTKPANL